MAASCSGLPGGRATAAPPPDPPTGPWAEGAAPVFASLASSRSASLEDGGALFPEGAEALLMVLALEAERLRVALALEVGDHVAAEPVVERALRGPERDGRARGEPRHDLAGGPVEVGRRHGAGDEADALGLLRADALAQQQELGRLGHAHEPRQEIAHARVRPAEPHSGEGEAEAGGGQRK